jgi:hypothetical protein
VNRTLKIKLNCEKLFKNFSDTKIQYLPQYRSENSKSLPRNPTHQGLSGP